MPLQRLEPCGSKDPCTVLRGLDAGNRAQLPDRTVVDAVQTDDCALQVHADSARYLAEPGQRVAQQGQFVTVAGSGDERRDDVAAAIAQGHHLVALEMFVAAVTEVIAAFLCRRRRAIAVNDRQIRQLVIIKPAYRGRKDGLHATSGLPAAKRTVDPRVVNLGQPFRMCADRQHFPLTSHIQRLQDVVEDLVQRPGRGRATPTLAPVQMRQDKLLELRHAQFCWNGLPAWISRHSPVQKSGL